MELFPSVSKNSKSFFFLWELEVILPLYDLALFTSLKSQAEKYCSLICCERKNTVPWLISSSEQGIVSSIA